MDYQNLKLLKENNAAWRLLNATSSPFILSFIFLSFKEEEKITIDAYELQEKLVGFMEFELDDQPEEQELSQQERARQWLLKWIDSGWLRQYPDEKGNDWIELTTATEKALNFAHSLKAQPFIGTESRFKDIFRRLKELVTESLEDPEEKIEELEAQKRLLDLQIAQIKDQNRVTALDDVQISERWFELEKSVRELMGDFREVEQNFKDITREIYDHEADQKFSRGEVLGQALDRVEDLKNHPQGRSFYAFWEFLIDDKAQDELKIMTEKVYDLIEARKLPNPNQQIRYFRHHLHQNGKKVFASNQLLAEKLNRIIGQQNIRDRKHALQVIQEIRTLASQKRDSTPTEPDFWQVETSAQVDFPIDRPLADESLTSTMPTNPEMPEIDLDQANTRQLANQFFVNPQKLQQNIRQILKDKNQVSLEEVLHQFPPEKGLTEILTYLSIASGSTRHKILEDEGFSLHLPGFSPKKLQLPNVIYTK